MSATVPGTLLGTRNTSAKKTQNLHSMEFAFQGLDICIVSSWCHLTDILMKVSVTAYVKQQKQVWLKSRVGGHSQDCAAQSV